MTYLAKSCMFYLRWNWHNTHLSMHIHSPLVHTCLLQLQTTSKENAGAQKNVMSLITRNRITVCFEYLSGDNMTCSYHFWHCVIQSAHVGLQRVVGPKPEQPDHHDSVVKICVLFFPHLSHARTHARTHTHTHTHTHTAKVGYLWQGEELRNCH